MKEYLEEVLHKLKNAPAECLKLSLRDVHARGIFSLVYEGTEFGKLNRIFIADRKLKPFEVQLHTHRYRIKLTVLKGDITHHTAEYHRGNRMNTVCMSEYKYTSFLNGGDGLKYNGEQEVSLLDYKIPIGSSISLSIQDFHTMSCSKGSIWIVEEQGFDIDSSKVLGVPFTVDGLYNPPAMFQINDKLQQVIRTIKKILLNYKLTEND